MRTGEAARFNSRIALESDNFRKLHAFGRLERVAGDGGSNRNFVHFDVDVEVRERSLYDVCIPAHVSDARRAVVVFKKSSGGGT